MRSIRSLLATLAVVVVLLAIADLAFAAVFPTMPRLATNFSPAYLRREIGRLAAQPQRPPVVFAGDSVFWGYGIPAGDAAVTLLRGDGCACANLAFEGGSPANVYATLRILLAAGVRPKLFVFNVNQKEFNPADSAYQRLHPTIDQLASPLLSASERALLTPYPPNHGLDALIDARLAQTWRLYGMRSDLRESLFGDVDAAHAVEHGVAVLSGAAARTAAEHVATSDRFEGTYDMTPLDGGNVSVRFLTATAALLQREHVASLAILTPTNHRLLHDYIDSPNYQANLAYARNLLQRYGVRVLDLDARFGGAEFIDNDHLTVAGNRHLRAVLEAAVRP